jgi:hypothetical protein
MYAYTVNDLSRCDRVKAVISRHNSFPTSPHDLLYSFLPILRIMQLDLAYTYRS